MTDDFKSAYARWIDEPIPGRSSDPRVDHLQMELVDADEFVAAEAVPVASGQPYPTGGPDVGLKLENLHALIRELRPLVPPSEQTRLDAYLAYLGRLKDVHRTVPKT
jgi:hypothetical protein